ncbi:hypothetical protein CcaCcLH18_03787 [Colletotrichum camelliae]|nr:hypothetical protein CcaCcLH18_03787 [Colletotrichum camelliae]
MRSAEVTVSYKNIDTTSQSDIDILSKDKLTIFSKKRTTKVSMGLNGWDVVSLVPIPFVNAAIQSQGDLPKILKVSLDTLEIQAEFGTWQITVGGSSNIIMFDIPLTDISGKDTKEKSIISQFDYRSLAARVQLFLTFVDGGRSGHNLVVDSKSPPTSIVSLTDANGHPLPSILDDALIKQALTTWLGDNLSQFNHVFASIDIDPGTASNTQWSFCKPAVVAYTYVAGSTLANSYLGLTYNTAGNTKPGSTAQIDPSFVPPGCQSAFMISPAIFLNNFLAPSTRQQFGIPPQSFNVNTSNLSISLAAGTQVALPKVSANSPAGSSSVFGTVGSFLGGLVGISPSISDSDTTYQPELVDLQISVQNSIIKIYAKTSTVVINGAFGTVTAFNESQSWLTLGLDAARQSLAYKNTQPSVNNHYIQQSESFTIIQDILQAIGIVTVAVGAVLTDGADLLMVSALSGIASGGEQFALSSIESNNKNAAPEINSLVSNLTLPVRWSRAGPFAAATAGLYQGGFFIAGTMRPAS